MMSLCCWSLTAAGACVICRNFARCFLMFLMEKKFSFGFMIKMVMRYICTPLVL